MTWAFGQMLALDTETTGVNVESDRIVTATAVDIVPGQEALVTSHLIAVDVEIPQAATDVHGVTTEHARENGKPAGEVLEAVAAHIAEALSNGVPLVGCNISYDLTILDRELRRNGLVPLTERVASIAPVIDVRRPDTNQPQNGLILCGSATSAGQCHERVESRRAEARQFGWAIRQSDDPLAVPVLHARYGWVRLTVDGGYVPSEPIGVAA